MIKEIRKVIAENNLPIEVKAWNSQGYYQLIGDADYIHHLAKIMENTNWTITPKKPFTSATAKYWKQVA